MSSNTKKLPVRVFGLTEEELEALRGKAEKQYGKASVSLLAKKLLKAELEQEEPPAKPFPPPQGKKRITLRLPDKDTAYLTDAAAIGGCSVNDVCRDIIQSHIRRHPFLTNTESEALHSSNYQLLRIGRNLNQIARQMNFGEPVSLTLRHITELKNIIDAHTRKVGHVLQANRKRSR